MAGASQTNPLAGLPWGNYTGPEDEVFPGYNAASGAVKRLLGRVALRPRMRWFGSWYGDQWIGSTLRKYLSQRHQGNPYVMAQMAIFRLDPWENAACSALPSAAQQASYRHWIDSAAAAIGAARVALVLQPDLPFERACPTTRRSRMHQVAYAARAFSALPHTSVYIDAGAGDWPSVGEAAQLLRAAGIRYARGFALNATHYDPTESEIRFGAKVVRALAAAGHPEPPLRDQHILQRARLHLPAVPTRPTTTTRPCAARAPSATASRSGSRRPATWPTADGGCRAPRARWPPR